MSVSIRFNDKLVAFLALHPPFMCIRNLLRTGALREREGGRVVNAFLIFLSSIVADTLDTHGSFGV